MQSMQTSMQASAIMNGTTLIGRSILAPGSQATLATGGAIGGAVQAPAGTSQLTVSVQDSTGATVDTFNVTPADTGLTSFLWKGATSTGATAAAGTYTIGVTATVGRQDTDTQSHGGEQGRERPPRSHHQRRGRRDCQRHRAADLNRLSHVIVSL